MKETKTENVFLQYFQSLQVTWMRFSLVIEKHSGVSAKAVQFILQFFLEILNFFQPHLINFLLEFDNRFIFRL